MVAVENGAGKPMDSGQARLEALGYKQMLKRDLSFFSNFALSFTFVAILAGVSVLYGTGLRYGGPISMVYGWIIAASFNLCVALSMAEICSAYSTDSSNSIRTNSYPLRTLGPPGNDYCTELYQHLRISKSVRLFPFMFDPQDRSRITVANEDGRDQHVHSAILPGWLFLLLDRKRDQSSVF